MAKVFLDYGHGGNDSGAVGCGLYEKNITLQVGKKVKAILESNKIQVIESRSGDTNPSLEDRANISNNNNADVSVSIHCNCNSGTPATGVETYAYSTSCKGYKLAQEIHSSILNDKSIYKVNRGVKTANFAMVRRPNAPACLVEMAFINNPEDAKILSNKQNEFAIAISKGILKYLGLNYNGIVPSTTTSNTVCSVAEGKKYLGNRSLELQQKLNKIGYKLTEDGDYGQLTHNAVIDFQSKNGLMVDGYFGEKSWVKLNDAINKKQISSELYRVYESNKQVGAYSSVDNAIEQVKVSLQKGCKEVKITK